MKRISIAISIVMICLLGVTSARGQVPGIINYQGRVIVAGTNFDGTGQFKFALVNAAGTTRHWSNGVSTVSLTVTKGLYSVLLGDTTIPNMSTAIPATVFTNADVRLRVWFNDGVSGLQQLSPDQRLAAVGYALMSARHDASADLYAMRLKVGTGHTLSGAWATIAGGYFNTATNDYAAVGGGQLNAASGAAAMVGGGEFNTASGAAATVGGGYFNAASNDYATVGGGAINTASGLAATVGGGEDNTASGSWFATVGGGYGNTASNDYATVGGGAVNTASGNYATVSGGEFNTASGNYATVGGGYFNTASNDYATVGGGYDNTASRDYATVSGGQGNTASD
jgi:hypothetical protein